MNLNLEFVFSSRERVKVLKEIIYSEKEIGINEIAKKTKMSKGFISKYFDILAKEKVLSKKRMKFVVENNAKVKSLRVMLNILKIDIKVFKNYKFIKAAGLYGSCAKGTNTESSDVDLWVKIDNAEGEDLVKMSSELRKKIKNVKLLILNSEKIVHLQESDPLFYHSLYFGSILLHGNENEI